VIELVEIVEEIVIIEVVLDIISGVEVELVVLVISSLVEIA
jgi:hypothetical protein